MTTTFNVLTRPKRSIHSRKIVITEELAKLIGGKDYNSESDEEFIPDEKPKSNKKVKLDKSSDCDESESDSDDDSEDTVVKNEDDDDDDDISSDEENAQVESGDESAKDEEAADQEAAKDSKTKLVVEKKPRKKRETVKKEPLDESTSKKTPGRRPQSAKKKREYNKRKKLHQLKVDEIKSENKKILEKLSSRVKSSSTVNKQANSTISGPVVRLESTQINAKTYPMYIVSNNRNTEPENVNTQNGSSSHKAKANAEQSTVKIPKEKIPAIEDPKGLWFCKLCSKRPNFSNLGDLFGPYFINDDDNEADNNDDNSSSKRAEVWMHEACIVWTPNVYIKDSKIFGLSDALNFASTVECMICSKKGATLNCSKPFCNSNFHYPCAVAAKCKFDDENFTTTCKQHS